MAKRLILHIGSMKSGTSFLQNVLQTNKASLMDQGVLFAGRNWNHQVRAVRDITDNGGPDQPPLDEQGPWRTVVEEIHRWPDTAVVSMEFLAPRATPKIEAILGFFPDTRVEVVLTARDLTRNIPAMWLESVQNGSTVGWDDFLDAVQSRPATHPAGRGFWKHQSVAKIARRWTRSVGRDHFVLITVPPRGAPPELLWQRFAEMLGVAWDGVDLGVRANPGIGLATALALRRLNEVLVADGQRPAHYDFYVKHLLTKRGLVARQSEEPRLGLDAPWAVRRANAELRDLAQLDLTVIGDLDDLRPQPVKGVHPDQVPLDDQLAAAVAGMARLVEVAAQRDRQHRRELRRARQAAQAVRAAQTGRS